MEVPAPSLKNTDILIGVMGMTGVGKTSFVKQVTDLNMKIGHGLDSCESLCSDQSHRLAFGVQRF